MSAVGMLLEWFFLPAQELYHLFCHKWMNLVFYLFPGELIILHTHMHALQRDCTKQFLTSCAMQLLEPRLARSSQEYWLCLPLQVWAVPPVVNETQPVLLPSTRPGTRLQMGNLVSTLTHTQLIYYFKCRYSSTLCIKGSEGVAQLRPLLLKTRHLCSVQQHKDTCRHDNQSTCEFTCLPSYVTNGNKKWNVWKCSFSFTMFFLVYNW